MELYIKKLLTTFSELQTFIPSKRELQFLIKSFENHPSIQTELLMIPMIPEADHQLVQIHHFFLKDLKNLVFLGRRIAKLITNFQRF